MRSITPEQLENVLREHAQWLGNDKQGEKADLRETNLSDSELAPQLRHADLRKAYIREADFHGLTLLGPKDETYRIGAQFANADLIRSSFKDTSLLSADFKGALLHEAQFQKSELKNSDFQGAVLIDADFEGASLAGANLSDTNLSYANLKSVTGLKSAQLAGADLSGAKLPEPLSSFKSLDSIKELSKNARTLSVSLLLACIYTWLTVATTSDAALVSNAGTSVLPLLGTALPISGFFLVVPIILLSLYIYLHLYLQRLWDLLAQLPAIFPDTERLDQKADHWLMLGIVNAYFPRLRNQRPPLSRLQNAISITLTFGIVPMTLLFCWQKYLRRHDLKVSLVHSALIAFSIAVWVLFRWLTARTLRRQPLQDILGKAAFRNATPYTLVALVGLAFFFLAVLSVESIRGIDSAYVTMEGSSGGLRLLSRKVRADSTLHVLVPKALAVIGISPWADLREADLSIRPGGWTGTDSELKAVRGALLTGANLNFAKAERAFLVNSDLRGASLIGANLIRTDLRGARMERDPWRSRATDLKGALLVEADLRGANLRGADLRGADLFLANLTGANLEFANLEGAYLGHADLSAANLHMAELGRAYLGNIKGLTQNQLNQACMKKPAQKLSTGLHMSPRCSSRGGGLSF
jgi:uncharacterized protein YjbI with pentapeptide repeats